MRFILPAVIVSALAAGFIYQKLKPWLAITLFSLLLLIQFSATVFFNEKFLEPFKLFAVTREKYIAEKITYYDACKFTGEYLKDRGRVLFLGDARSFYSPLPVVAYTVFNKREIFSGFSSIKNSDFLMKLKEKSVAIIMINRSELSRVRATGNNEYADIYDIITSEKFKKIMEKYFDRIYTDINCDVYVIQDEDKTMKA